MIDNLVDVNVSSFLHSPTAGLPEAMVSSSKSLTAASARLEFCRPSAVRRPIVT